MSRTPSTMLPLETKAPDFHLPDTEGNFVSLEDYKKSPALLLIFMCNHCPFVKHIIDDLVDLIPAYQAKGLAVLAINSNDVESYPEDRPEKMVELVREKQFTFPYLYDETQEVAKAYHAACTPDFFLFDAEHKLAYRGQMDESRPGNGIPVTGADLRAAIEAVLEGKDVPTEQRPSIGCNIKWKQGNEPDYFK